MPGSAVPVRGRAVASTFAFPAPVFSGRLRFQRPEWIPALGNPPVEAGDRVGKGTCSRHAEVHGCTS